MKGSDYQIPFFLWQFLFIQERNDLSMNDIAITITDLGRGLQIRLFKRSDFSGYAKRSDNRGGHKIDTISGEAFTGGNLLAVNVKVNDIDPAGSEIVEADLYQGFAQRPHWTGDVILYGIEATECRCRGIVGRQLRDAAFVDIKFQNLGNALCVTRFSQGLENVLFARLDMVDQAWEWMRQDSGRENVWPRNVRLFDVKASKFTGYDTTDGSEGLLVESKCDWLPAK